jgi:transcriptional regulator with XRE-family HTH domain
MTDDKIKLTSVIGANICRKLHAQGLRQKDIVSRTGMCKSHVSEIINGHNRHPSVWTAQRIADALGCRVDDLLNVKVPV